MEIDGFKFNIKPSVIQNLPDPVNIGSGLLETIGDKVLIRSIFNGKNNQLKVGNKSLEMIKALNEGNIEHKDAKKNSAKEKISPHLNYAKMDTICRANTVTFVDVDPKEKELKVNEDIQVESKANEREETVGALYTWKKETNQIAILNHNNTAAEVGKRMEDSRVEKKKCDGRT